MSYTSTPELIKESKKDQLLQVAVDQHPSFLVQRCIFEDIHLTIEEVDMYLAYKELKEDPVDRIWLLKKLSEGYVLDAPYHLIKLILKQ